MNSSDYQEAINNRDRAEAAKVLQDPAQPANTDAISPEVEDVPTKGGDMQAFVPIGAFNQTMQQIDTNFKTHSAALQAFDLVVARMQNDIAQLSAKVNPPVDNSSAAEAVAQ